MTIFALVWIIGGILMAHEIGLLPTSPLYFVAVPLDIFWAIPVWFALLAGSAILGVPVLLFILLQSFVDLVNCSRG